MRHMVFLLVAALAVAQPIATLAGIPPAFPTWHVHVVNGLSNDVLFVHCKSKDDDLGNHNMVGRGTEFQWTFKLNFFATTLYWCYLHKPNADISFEAFWCERDTDWLRYRCDRKVCIWTAKDDGIYLRNIPDNVDELVHPWEKG